MESVSEVCRRGARSKDLRPPAALRSWASAPRLGTYARASHSATAAASDHPPNQRISVASLREALPPLLVFVRSEHLRHRREPPASTRRSGSGGLGVAIAPDVRRAPGACAVVRDRAARVGGRGRPRWDGQRRDRAPAAARARRPSSRCASGCSPARFNLHQFPSVDRRAGQVPRTARSDPRSLVSAA
jgi:hypothetical protein